jgi:DNA-binding winged helix-turn-helix (wHTH) protein/TolB-like protein
LVSRFLDSLFDPVTGELSVNGRRQRLEPQPAKVLALLVSRPGEVISREQLQRDLWPAETYVDAEQGLNYCIRQVRAALGDSATEPRFIETLPKRGYRFLPAVEASGTNGQAPPGRVRAYGLLGALLAVAFVAGSAIGPRKPIDLPTIAVTLFANETDRPELDRVAQIYTDVLVERLARSDSRWSVIGNASILRTKRPFLHLESIASSLHAQYIVLGQLIPGKPGVTVLTHFIRSRDLKHLWVGRTEGRATDEVDIPRRVADRVEEASRRLLADRS